MIRRITSSPFILVDPCKLRVHENLLLLQVGRRAGALKTRGIGGILDYAAEVDLRPAEERAEREAKRKAAGDDRLLLEVRCCWWWC